VGLALPEAAQTVALEDEAGAAHDIGVVVQARQLGTGRIVEQRLARLPTQTLLLGEAMRFAERAGGEEGGGEQQAGDDPSPAGELRLIAVLAPAQGEHRDGRPQETAEGQARAVERPLGSEVGATECDQQRTAGGVGADGEPGQEPGVGARLPRPAEQAQPEVDEEGEAGRSRQAGGAERMGKERRAEAGEDEGGEADRIPHQWGRGLTGEGDEAQPAGRGARQPEGASRLPPRSGARGKRKEDHPVDQPHGKGVAGDPAEDHGDDEPPALLDRPEQHRHPQHEGEQTEEDAQLPAPGPVVDLGEAEDDDRQERHEAAPMAKREVSETGLAQQAAHEDAGHAQSEDDAEHELDAGVPVGQQRNSQEEQARDERAVAVLQLPEIAGIEIPAVEVRDQTAEAPLLGERQVDAVAQHQEQEAEGRQRGGGRPPG
jgi:hypothetical protein